MNRRLISDQDLAEAIDQAALCATTYEKVTFFGLTMGSVRATVSALKAAGVATLTLGFDHGALTYEDVINRFTADPEVTALVVAAPACYGVSLPASFADMIRFDLGRDYADSVSRAKVLAAASA